MGISFPSLFATIYRNLERSSAPSLPQINWKAAILSNDNREMMCSKFWEYQERTVSLMDVSKLLPHFNIPHKARERKIDEEKLAFVWNNAGGFYLIVQFI